MCILFHFWFWCTFDAYCSCHFDALSRLVLGNWRKHDFLWQSSDALPRWVRRIWDDFLQYQHLCLILCEDSSTLRWFIDLWCEADRNGAVACMCDFMSTFIHFINFFKVAFSPSRSRSRDQTFLSPGHILCSDRKHVTFSCRFGFQLPLGYYSVS